MLKIYYTDVRNLDEERFAAELSLYRKEKLNRLKPEAKRRQMLGAELLLNRAVTAEFSETELPLSIKTGEYGKPYIEKLPLQFSLSHSGKFAVCAVSDNEIGVDIQQKSRYRENLAKRQFTIAEYEYIAGASDRDAAFTKIWSQKESVLKALGIGINMAMNSFSVIPENKILVSGKVLSLLSGSIEDYSLAVSSISAHMDDPEIIEIKF